MNLCYEIAARLYRKKHAGEKPDNRSPEEVRRDYWQWQYDSSEVYFAKFHDLYDQIKGKRILDIGCGLGGRACFLASRGPAEIVATDINHEEIDLAVKFADEKLDAEARKRIKFEKVCETLPTDDTDGHRCITTTKDTEYTKNCINASASQEDLCNGCYKEGEERGNGSLFQTEGRKDSKGRDVQISHPAPACNAMRSIAGRSRIPDPASANTRHATPEKPVELELFDIVLLVDSMEHVRDPAAMLNLAFENTKPGGLCYLSTVGWYNHMASHVGSIVPIPFATVFFPDSQILDAVRRIVSQPWYVPSIWDTDPPIKRWEGINDLSERPDEYLNKITVKKLRDVVGKSKFVNVDFKVQGFSGRLPLLKMFNFLSKVPVIQEVYHSGVFVRLKKSSNS